MGVGRVISRPHPESKGPAIKIDRIKKERDLISFPKEVACTACAAIATVAPLLRYRRRRSGATVINVPF